MDHAIAFDDRGKKAAMKDIGNTQKKEVGHWANNRLENSHMPIRRRKRALSRFRNTKNWKKFSSVHASVHNHFSRERHLVDRQEYRKRRSAALAEWRAVMR